MCVRVLCALKGLSLVCTLEVLFNVGLLSISVKRLMREVSRNLERSGWCRPVSEERRCFPFHNYSTSVVAVFAFFSLSLKCFVTTCTGLRSASDQHDPLSASVPSSLRSIYCTSGNAAELDDVAPGRSQRATATHSDSVHTSRGGRWENAVYQNSIMSYTVRYSDLFCVYGFDVMKVTEHRITDTSRGIRNDLGADSTAGGEFFF